jgi:hypothetical protein
MSGRKPPKPKPSGGGTSPPQIPASNVPEVRPLPSEQQLGIIPIVPKEDTPPKLDKGAPDKEKKLNVDSLIRSVEPKFPTPDDRSKFYLDLRSKLKDIKTLEEWQANGLYDTFAEELAEEECLLINQALILKWYESHKEFEEDKDIILSLLKIDLAPPKRDRKAPVWKPSQWAANLQKKEFYLPRGTSSKAEASNDPFLACIVKVCQLYLPNFKVSFVKTDEKFEPSLTKEEGKELMGAFYGIPPKRLEIRQFTYLGYEIHFRKGLGLPGINQANFNAYFTVGSGLYTPSFLKEGLKFLAKVVILSKVIHLTQGLYKAYKNLKPTERVQKVYTAQDYFDKKCPWGSMKIPSLREFLAPYSQLERSWMDGFALDQKADQKLLETHSKLIGSIQADFAQGDFERVKHKILSIKKDIEKFTSIHGHVTAIITRSRLREWTLTKRAKGQKTKKVTCSREEVVQGQGFVSPYNPVYLAYTAIDGACNITQALEPLVTRDMIVTRDQTGWKDSIQEVALRSGLAGMKDELLRWGDPEE